MSSDIEKIVEIGARAISPYGDWLHADDIRAMRRILSALTAAGFAVLPREATDAMCDEGENAIAIGPPPADLSTSPSASWAVAKSVYRAMVETFSPVKG